MSAENLSPMKLWRVVAGGQTGVDQAALRAAQNASLGTGGWCPPGSLNENPALARYGLLETPTERSDGAPLVPRSQRTEWNVRDADALLVLFPLGAARKPGLEGDAGTLLALKCASHWHLPCLVADPFAREAARAIGSWLWGTDPGVLNIAGPSEAAAPGVEQKAHSLLVGVFTRHTSQRSFR